MTHKVVESRETHERRLNRNRGRTVAVVVDFAARRFCAGSPFRGSRLPASHNHPAPRRTPRTKNRNPRTGSDVSSRRPPSHTPPSTSKSENTHAQKAQIILLCALNVHLELPVVELAWLRHLEHESTSSTYSVKSTLPHQSLTIS